MNNNQKKGNGTETHSLAYTHITPKPKPGIITYTQRTFFLSPLLQGSLIAKGRDLMETSCVELSVPSFPRKKAL